MNDLEKTLGRVLGTGVRISTIALVAGLAAIAVSGAHILAIRLLTIGMLILIGTPLARVAVSSLAYARRREWMFMVLTLIVLAELVASIVAAVRAH
jgi:uncharacterized membrane protein